jgi:hypothetical protein
MACSEERFWDAEQQCFWLRLRDEGDFGEQWLRKELLPPASTGLWENLREIKPICVKAFEGNSASKIYDKLHERMQTYEKSTSNKRKTLKKAVHCP